MPPGETRALAISPDGHRLYVASQGGGVFWFDLEGLELPYAFRPGAERLCLAGGRYAVELIAGQSRVEDHLATARTLNDRSGYFSLPFITGDPELPEVVVKMLPDGTFGPGAPIFYTSLTTLPFVMRVTDTVTGGTKEYRNDSGQPLCGGADIAFGASLAAEFIPLAASAPTSSDGELRLLGDRYLLTLAARHPRTGRAATGHGVFRNDRFGYFSFPGLTGDADFPEVFVKMLDFRSITGTFLLFHAGLTSLDYTLTVTDTVTGAVRTYGSPGDFCGHVETLSPN